MPTADDNGVIGVIGNYKPLWFAQKAPDAQLANEECICLPPTFTPRPPRTWNPLQAWQFKGGFSQ